MEKVKILEKSYANRSKLSFFKVTWGLEPPLPIAGYGSAILLYCYTAILIEKTYQIMSKFVEVFKNDRKKFLKFSKSWIKFRFILEKVEN